MDKHKWCMMNHVGIAGMKCNCYNSFHGPTKKKISRMARAKMKQDQRKEVEEMKGEDHE